MLLQEKMKMIRHETVAYKTEGWCGLLKVAFLQVTRESGKSCAGGEFKVVGENVCKSLIVLMIFENCLLVATTVIYVVKIIFCEISLEIFTGHNLMLADEFEGCVPSRMEVGAVVG